MGDRVKLKGILDIGYGLSPKLVMKDTNLSIEAKAIYAYMSSFAGNGESAYPSISLACKDLNVSEDRYRKHRDMLVRKGYITIEKQKKSGKFHNNVYIINQQIEPPYPQNTGAVKHHDGKTPTRKNVGTNNNSSFNNNSISNNNSKDIVGKPDNVPYKMIVEYLNNTANKKYKHTTGKTRTLIQARYKEGFSFDDFTKVIDTKTMEWRNDPKMQKFLRPETLFGNKFESYLNQQAEMNHNPFDYDPNKDSF